MAIPKWGRARETWEPGHPMSPLRGASPTGHRWHVGLTGLADESPGHQTARAHLPLRNWSSTDPPDLAIFTARQAV